MANYRERGTTNAAGKWCFDPDTLTRSRQSLPGSIGLHPAGTDPGDSRGSSTVFSYSISGNPGALGSMFLTEAMEKLKGTWYDKTGAVTKFRKEEAKLGKTEFANPEFRRMAEQILANMDKPASVNADIQFEKRKGGVETAFVSGPRGSRSFRFDRKEAEKVVIPEGADPFKPFLDAIDKIIALVLTVR